MKWGFIFLAFVLVGCSEKNVDEKPWVNICSDLAWLEALQGSINQSGHKAEIYLAHYLGQRVFEVNPCLDCAEMITTVYDCQGQVICAFGGLVGLNTCPDYAPDPETKLLYWKN